MSKNRRRHFFIDHPLQIRYMCYIIIPLTLVSAVTIISLYFGIWGSVLDAFSDEKIRNDLLTASRLSEYDSARYPAHSAGNTLSLFRQSEKLSSRQKEIFREILDEANRKLLIKFLILLFFIAWGSIYISHKTAGPLFRFHITLDDIEKGNLRTRVRLRKGDEAHPLAVRFNQTLENLDRIFSRIKSILREESHHPEHLKKKIHEEVDKFKTSGETA